MTKTKYNHAEIVEQLEAELAILKSRKDKAFLDYKNSGAPEHRDETLWLIFRQYDREVERYEATIKFHKIMSQETAYATEHLWSDAHAYEIIEEKSDRIMIVRRMKATPNKEALKELHASFVPGGFCGHFDNDLQKWDFESDERNGLETIRKHKDGGWYSASGMYFTINAEPHEKYDYNF